MTYIGKSVPKSRSPVLGRRTRGVVMAAALVALSTLSAAQADPPTPGSLFAHKYKPLLDHEARASAGLALLLRAPTFRALVETRASLLPGWTRPDVIGGIHQGAKAVILGAAAGRPVRFEYRNDGQILLWVGDQSLVSGLQAAQARPMASLVEEGNNGLVALNDSVRRNGKRVHTPKLARSYIDTEEGFWLLWTDAISEDLFFQVEFANGEFPHGLTIVDAEPPVTINAEGTLAVHGAEPRVAFWKRLEEDRGKILRCDDLGRILKPRGEDDEKAIADVRRLFKWAPVMRLAAESDPAAFRAFVSELDQVRIATVATPSLLIED